MTETRKYFEVAGFRFSLEMPVFSPAWKALSNYDPFVTEAGPVLFTVRTVAEWADIEKEPLMVLEPEDDMPVLNLYRTAAGYRVEMSPCKTVPICGRLDIDSTLKEGRLAVNVQRLETFCINNAMMLLYAFNTAVEGALEMHSSVVMQNGRGYLFLGKSGTGKSTHSSLWLKYIPGTELLNDDNPILRVLPDGSVRVYGSPWSGKTPCYKAMDVPVGAVVRIRQAPENRITRLPVIQAYASVFASCSAFRPFRELADGWHRSIGSVAASVPCFVLDCLPDEGAARLCHSTVSHG